MKKIQNIKDIARSYKAIFCDVWGVLHNGIYTYEEAVECLAALKQDGKQIILITNSPRLSSEVAQQLAELDICPDIYDHLVTSGEVTRFLIAQSPRKLFYIGPEKSINIIDGLDVELVDDVEAQAILCTGLFPSLASELDEYEALLRKAKARKLPFICANPDIEVFYGNELIYCAGALARLYSSMGGTTLIAGKPSRAIYEFAFNKLSGSVEKSDILAIGDGLLTDIKGAIDYGLDSIYILEGVNREKLKKNDEFDDELVENFVQQHNLHPIACMEYLK